jgi:hypothetical protein
VNPLLWLVIHSVPVNNQYDIRSGIVHIVTTRMALVKSPTSRNPVGGATGVQYTRRSADGIDDTFAQPKSIHETGSYGLIDRRVLNDSEDEADSQ